MKFSQLTVAIIITLCMISCANARYRYRHRYHNSERSENNLDGAPLDVCGTDPMTGYWRNGKCSTGRSDYGTHTVCAVMTDDFLLYSKSKGNDLITPRSWGFPGLKAGDHWCLCAIRWREALKAPEGDKAPPVFLSATNKETLRYVSRDILESHEYQEK